MWTRRGPYSRGLLRDYEPSDGPSFQALISAQTHIPHAAVMTGAGSSVQISYLLQSSRSRAAASDNQDSETRQN